MLYFPKTRETKDRYVDSNFKNFLEEISTDLANYGTYIILRNLLFSSISLQMAQNLKIYYHSAIEDYIIIFVKMNKIQINL